MTWSAAGIRFAFCSISTLTAVFITLCVAKYGGFARGAVTGLTLGHLADGELFLPLALLGAVASVLFSFGVFSACGISATAAGVLAAMLNGPEALLSVIPDLVISIAVSSPILRYKLLYKDFPYPSIAPVIPETPSDRSKALLDRLSSWKRLSAASDSIATLDERVASITSASAPGVAAEEGAERIRDQLCHDCPMSAICLENENDRTRNALNGLLLGQNDGSEYLSEHCVRLDDMLKLAKKEARSVINAKAPVRSPLLSYSSASALMTSLAEKAENELQFDRDAEAAITRALYNAGVPFSGISVLGRTRKPIYLYGADRKKLSKALPSLLPEIGKVLLCDYVGPSYGADGDAPAVFVPKRRLSAEIAFRSLSKDGQSVCGDTAISFSDDEGNLFALIADGMGSGHSACRSSGVTAEMIRTLSVCGIGGRLAASLADEALKSLCDECFSTVDLLRIDLISGNASLTKSYAAPSFLLRNGSVYRCAPASLPIGACDCSEASEESFKLGAGDTVLMVSDGICDGNEQALTDLLGLSSALKAEEIADRIISRLAPSGRTDDMSAIVIRLSEAV
jgi:stage II sporulation protein E